MENWWDLLHLSHSRLFQLGYFNLIDSSFLICNKRHSDLKSNCILFYC
jgi:hypothetical protein